MSPSTRRTTSAAGPPAGRGGRDSQPSYSPARRTGLLFAGTGTHGVYHAGVLRALQEAGVRIDLVAGHGVGAASAMLAAIDGGPRLWDEQGLWAARRAPRYYRWRWPIRLTGRIAVLTALLCLAPLAVLLVGALVYLAGFVLTLAGSTMGLQLAGRVSAGLANAFAGPALPTVVPRLVMLAVLAAAGVLAASVVMARPVRDGLGRVIKVRWWWRVSSAALDSDALHRAVARVIWELVRGAASGTKPSDDEVSRRYCEVLAENLGQPGCRELLVGITDLDARRDVVGALLAAEHQERFFASQPGRERGAEVVDLAWSGRDMAIGLLRAALTPAFGAAAPPVTFPQDGYWHGETHRACDRPGLVTRLLAELRLAGVAQLVLVSAAAPVLAPHRLRPPALEPRARLGEFFAAAEAAELDTIVDLAAPAFEAVFVIAPAHNPIGPFDTTGAYDEGSDRRRRLDELRQDGYHDAYQQFIDPIVGASGEELAPATL